MDGKVKAIDISYGDGFDAMRVKYSMNNLDRPFAYYSGSDVKNDDAIIKKVLPDSKIQKYVNQGERYQAEIRKVVE